MKSLVPSETIKVMEERHSVRAYEKGFKLPEEDLEAILKAAAGAPSSWNLQHWKFLVIESDEMKQKLLPIANNQQQVVDSSVSIAVLGDLRADLNGEAIYNELAEKGLIPENVKEAMLGQIRKVYTGPVAEQVARDEAIRNASFAAMQLMLAAKSLGYDTCPMGGYDARKLVQEFHIPDRYLPVLLISLGKAAKPAHATGRLPLEQLVVRDRF